MKRCIDCAVEKDLSEFYVKRVGSQVVQFYPRCKPCHNRWTYFRQGKTYVASTAARREKHEARATLRNAVRDGHITKPSRCQECSRRLAKDKIEGHHHNGYVDPLDVKWLCRKCHTKLHEVVHANAG